MVNVDMTLKTLKEGLAIKKETMKHFTSYCGGGMHA